jgi:chromosome segregation ATPase
MCEKCDFIKLGNYESEVVQPTKNNVKVLMSHISELHAENKKLKNSLWQLKWDDVKIIQGLKSENAILLNDYNDRGCEITDLKNEIRKKHEWNSELAETIKEKDAEIQKVRDDKFKLGEQNIGLIFDIGKLSAKLKEIKLQYNFQIQKLNTIELQQEAPLCWTKLQQFMEVMDKILSEGK